MIANRIRQKKNNNDNDSNEKTAHTFRIQMEKKNIANAR